MRGEAGRKEGRKERSWRWREKAVRSHFGCTLSQHAEIDVRQQVRWKTPKETGRPSQAPLSSHTARKWKESGGRR